ncbi:MAG: hypothetical protein Q8P13_01875 [bacterium]|nr:hypothetical protein [bacterium]
MFVKVVKVPAGEAPLHVREAWVGAVFPAYGPHEHLVEGVVTGESVPPRLRFSYAAPQRSALDALEQLNPVAASWFREHLLIASDFIFGADEVEETHNEV